MECGDFGRGNAGERSAFDAVEFGDLGGGGGHAGKVKYRKYRRSRSISVGSCGLHCGVISLGCNADVTALAVLDGRERCSVYTRVGSVRLGSAVGEECFCHGSTLAYRERVGQVGVRVGCGRVCGGGRYGAPPVTLVEAGYHSDGVSCPLVPARRRESRLGPAFAGTQCESALAYLCHHPGGGRGPVGER
jgi:hypothetical protein